MTPGHKYYSNESAWFADIRTGYQLGPVLLEAMGLFTTGNAARDTTLRTVKYYQPLDTDTSYLADWGGQLTALGVDYLDAMLENGNFRWLEHPMGQVRTDPARRPGHLCLDVSPQHLRWLERPLDSRGDPEERGRGRPRQPIIVPLFTGQAANAKSNYIGNEIFGGLTWRFAPGLALDSAGGYMWTGPALDAQTIAGQGPREARNAYILTSRIRFSF